MTRRVLPPCLIATFRVTFRPRSLASALRPAAVGVTTSFAKSTLKQGVSVLADEKGAPWVKYIHGDYGKGSWTFLGGHDPEDPQHQIGAAPTDLSLHPTSPGYRLILNNVLFPAAKKKPLKT